MKNGDQPAYPTESATINGTEFINHSVKDGRKYGGLTKREYFAAMAMQGIMSNPSCIPIHQVHFSNIAEDSIRAADELLKQLETK